VANFAAKDDLRVLDMFRRIVRPLCQLSTSQAAVSASLSKEVSRLVPSADANLVLWMGGLFAFSQIIAFHQMRSISHRVDDMQSQIDEADSKWRFDSLKSQIKVLPRACPSTASTECSSLALSEYSKLHTC
jgi:hypothetical protein